ncbi:putative pyridoxal kinase BUD17 [Spathaspora sp. JA1]|nr:putative pyridoxal kinase BUD17 [Spathaspora sp. JA1]
MENKSLLSISSHVVHGYVGNRVIVFPLQYVGWDVDAMNTTNYSNHPGYGSFTGTPSTPDSLVEIIDGLKKIHDFKDYDIVLTGYASTSEVLQVIKNELVKVFANNKLSPEWIVDPILGDNGRLYVSEKVIPVYRDIFATGYVSLITPNQFEFETLTGAKLKTWQDVKQTILQFDNKYKIKNIVISSVSIENQLYCVGYTSNTNRMFSVPINEIPCNFNGCGDLFTALLTNAFYNNKFTITPELISDIVTKLYKILEFSYKDELETRNNSELPVTLVKDIRVIRAKEFLLKDYTQELLDQVVYF